MPSLFLIENHPTMRNALRNLLEEEPTYTVIGEAESAEEALEQLPALEPDLCLVDLSLPGMSGTALIRELKILYPQLACLVLTVHSDSHYRAEAMAAGAIGYVVKDDPDEVLASIKKVLETFRL